MRFNGRVAVLLKLGDGGCCTEQVAFALRNLLEVFQERDRLIETVSNGLRPLVDDFRNRRGCRRRSVDLLTQLLKLLHQNRVLLK